MRVSTEEVLRKLKLLAHHTQEKHKEAFKKIKEPILLEVRLEDSKNFYFLINQEGIHFVEDSVKVKNKVIVAYKDLLRLIEKPSKAVRYLLEGRLRVEGDYLTVLDTLNRLFV